MKREEWNRNWERLSPDEAAKKRMQERLLQAAAAQSAPKNRNHGLQYGSDRCKLERLRLFAQHLPFWYSSRVCWRYGSSSKRCWNLRQSKPHRLLQLLKSSKPHQSDSRILETDTACIHAHTGGCFYCRFGRWFWHNADRRTDRIVPAANGIADSYRYCFGTGFVRNNGCCAADTNCTAGRFYRSACRYNGTAAGNAARNGLHHQNHNACLE